MLEAFAPTRLVTVAVANDYELVVAGLAAMLEPFGDTIAVADAVVVGEPVDSPVDVVLYDTFGRADRGLRAVSQLLSDDNVARVAVYATDPSERLVDAALLLGASGVLAKAMPAAAVADALCRLAEGDLVIERATADDGDGAHPGRDLGLSPRQAEIAALLLVGLRNHEIAEALYLDVNTVKTHLRQVFKILSVRNRVEAAAVLLDSDSFRRRRGL